MIHEHTLFISYSEMRLRPVLMTTGATVMGHLPLVRVSGALTEKRTYESLDECGADPGGQPDTRIEENAQIYRHVVWPHSGLLQSLLPGHQLR